ncbi:DUF2269 domain-containing protein [Azotobacter chroococcum]|jgi:uncharacterized membrane protein|uniref:DUF2269 domain-containing protein n=1 Tax=Azotobacter chroococcum TaxID=353 RepID=A0A4Q9VWB9_9GAMM|nr:DUF2269 domain-containing protein [Azotobacter chroococcum]NHN77817.1 DUF2269 domain-containing protein [Azotobacter chroococcum]TBW03977.1 DUF2269 domain-containing protein [Azotobacter chroococcum]TBW40601.1 DUF2269 domain-containing protein [Azotobacter chroococcum]
MSFYLLLKTLHILSSTLLFGTGLGSAYYAWRAWKSGQVTTIATTFRHLVTADWLFTTPTALLQPLSGAAMVYLAGWPLGQAWLLVTLALYVLAGLCWLPVVWLQIRVRDLAVQAEREGTPLPARAGRYMAWWFALGWPAFGVFVVIFFLMVLKPA